MRIAISAEDNNGMNSTVCEHFGHAPFFVVADVTDGQVGHFEVIPNPHFPNHGPGQVPEFLNRQGANAILTGGMGYRAIGFFDQFGIQVVTGATGTVAQALDAFVAGQLSGAAACAHGEHHGGDHVCEDRGHHLGN